jgi:hypothetical protein
MSLEQIAAQIAALQVLIAAGYALTESVVASYKALIGTLHADLSPDQIAAAWDSIIADATVGLALAKAQSGQA